jgi:DNA-directed RNA polymerase subunit RPC12/RpoP
MTTMFEPEYQDLACPKCQNREVYYDRTMGYYCMFCGERVSSEQLQAQIESDLCQIGAEERA